MLSFGFCKGLDKFFRGKDSDWNVFDFVVVTSMLAEQIMNLVVSENDTLGWVRMLRTVRLFRLLRVLRVLRVLSAFSEFRVLIASTKSGLEANHRRLFCRYCYFSCDCSKRE